MSLHNITPQIPSLLICMLPEEICYFCIEPLGSCIIHIHYSFLLQGVHHMRQHLSQEVTRKPQNIPSQLNTW